MKDSKGASRRGAMPAAMPNIASSSISAVQGDAHRATAANGSRSKASGSYVYFAHDVGRPRIIDELAPSVWIKSDRPGLQMAARVVLPRAVDPRSGWYH